MSPTKIVFRNRPHRITLRLSPEELMHIRQQADAANMRPARLLRELGMGSSLRAVQRFPEDVHHAIKGFGRNLNQLSHQANMGRVDKKEVEALRADVSHLLQVVLG